MVLNKKILKELDEYLNLQEHCSYCRVFALRETPNKIVNNAKLVCGSDFFDELEDYVDKLENHTWAQLLFDYIDEKNLKESSVYKKAYITKQTFSKIRSNDNYHPDKDTAIRLGLALSLNIDQMIDFLSKAGYSFDDSRRDNIIMFLLEHEEYSLAKIDAYLLHYNEKMLTNYD